MEKSIKSRDRILNAAVPVFARKGRHGAHMEEIANLAHINKAMIYYIFHDKDELYLEVLKFVIEKAWESFSPFAEQEIQGGGSCAEVLSRYISVQLSFFNKNRDYTRILVDAMSNGAKEIPIASKFIKESHKGSDPSRAIKDYIEKGKAENIIRDIDTDQLMISILGMIIIYFMSHSITESFNLEIKDEAKFMESREESIIDLVLSGILISDPSVTTKKKKTK